jgi:farnesyl diphosphate synthase
LSTLFSFFALTTKLLYTYSLSSMTSQTHLNGASAPTDKAARRKRFEDVFPVIAEELLGYVRGEGMPQDAVEWFERVSGVFVDQL